MARGVLSLTMPPPPSGASLKAQAVLSRETLPVLIWFSGE